VAIADSKPDVPSDTVTVLYRGKTHTLSGKDAASVREAAIDLLRTSCTEVGNAGNDADIRNRYDRAMKRSHVRVTFAKPIEVPKAGNNKVPVRVETLIIPFSPDLDPESVYVLAGQPFRVFRDFLPDSCEPLRAALIKAAIYPADAE
jgi:hypothetical protein